MKTPILQFAFFCFVVTSCRDNVGTKEDGVTNSEVLNNSEVQEIDKKIPAADKFSDFLNCYAEISLDRIASIDSLYQLGWNEAKPVPISKEHLRLFLPEIQNRYEGNSNYGYKVKISDDLTGVVNVLYGDTQVYQMHIFDINQKTIANLVINKFYGGLITCYGFNSKVYLQGEGLKVYRHCMRLLESCDEKPLDEDVSHNGEVIDTEMYFDFKSGKFSMIDERKKNVKLMIVSDNTSFGLKVVN